MSTPSCEAVVEVRIDAREYRIRIGDGLLDRADLFRDHVQCGRVVVVSSTAVAALYLARVSATLRACGCEVLPVVLPDGEEHKNWKTLNLVFDALMRMRAERRTPLFALGGGVVGDVAGFAAACYQRGMPFIQVPTTLLAQVDSSVGGKTAINHPLGKNMIGAFYQPRLVVADTGTLRTLPARELSAGLAEVVKYGLIRDPLFFEWLECNAARLINRDQVALAEAVRRSCENKAAVVAADEREETDVRALLNLGHTFGHAIETATGYSQWLHGEAVGAGMVLAAEASRRMGMITAHDVERIRQLFTSLGIPVTAPALGVERYLELMGHDKKVRSGRIRFVLLKAVGDAFVTAEVPMEILAAVLTDCVSRA